MRHLAAILGFVLVSLPLVVTPSWVVVLPAAVAALLMAAGIAALSVRLVAAGVWASLIEYALALAIGTRSLHRLGAMTMGVALMLILEVVDFARRFRGAAVNAAMIANQIRYWVKREKGLREGRSHDPGNPPLPASFAATVRQDVQSIQGAGLSGTEKSPATRDEGALGSSLN